MLHILSYHSPNSKFAACFLEDASTLKFLQTSALVKHFHSCVLKGEEYEEKDWESLMELPPHSSRKKAGGTPANKTE